MTARWLTVLIIAAALYAVVGLLAAYRASLKFGPRRNFAPPTGSEWQGIRYSLFDGMMPWAKESARRHLPTYITGIVYHLGIAAGFLVLISTLVSHDLTSSAKIVLMSLTLLGAAAGLGLLIKREIKATLRSISTPDDFLSNGLVTIFLIVAAGTLWKPQFAAAFLIVATMLFLYIPLGKIRHCFFFFLSRVTFGRFFGRRNVLPHRAANAKDSHVGR